MSRVSAPAAAAAASLPRYQSGPEGAGAHRGPFHCPHEHFQGRTASPLIPSDAPTAILNPTFEAGSSAVIISASLGT